MNYSFDNKYPLWHTHPGRIPHTNQIVIGEEVVDVYPDNDGNIWYYDKDRKKVVICQ